jgi:prepilin-type processing-associated H-X9-DG protein
MPIQFTCPHCGAQTAVADEYAGHSGPCAQCGKTITVPAAGSASRSAAAKGPSGVLLLAVAGVGVLAAVVVCGGVLVWSAMPAARAARAAAQQAACANNLRQIAAAVFAYRQRYDSFPPPYVADKDGRPMHSWRVLILPFLGRRALYDRYDFGEPWNGPHNLALVQTAPQVYRCPADPPDRRGETSYLMVVGPRTFSTVTGPMQLGEFPDGAVDTIMLVETVRSGVNWAEPRDLPIEQMSFKINGPPSRSIDGAARRGISSRHPGGANAAMCDGSVRLLNEWTSAEDVRAMTTIDGGERTGRK